MLQDGELLAVDPSEREEAAAEGALTVVLNTHSDVCAVRKCSGVGISMTQVSLPMCSVTSRPHCFCVGGFLNLLQTFPGTNCTVLELKFILHGVQVHRIMRLANSRAGELMADLKTALNSHDTSRVASRVRRQSGVSSLPGSSSRAVTVLQSEDISGCNSSLFTDALVITGDSAYCIRYLCMEAKH